VPTESVFAEYASMVVVVVVVVLVSMLRQGAPLVPTLS
jgi:hypothetical protein